MLERDANNHDCMIPNSTQEHLDEHTHIHGHMFMHYSKSFLHEPDDDI